MKIPKGKKRRKTSETRDRIFKGMRPCSFFLSLFSLLLLFHILFSFHFLITPLRAEEPVKLRKDAVKKEKQLESLKREIEIKKRGLAHNRRKESAILDEMDRLDKVLSHKQEELEKIEASLSKLQQKKTALDSRIQDLASQRELLAGSLEKRLVAMYKIKKGGFVHALFSTRSLHTMGKRYKYINTIAEYDSLLLKSYRDNVRALEVEKERLKDFEEEMLSLKEAVQSKKNEIAVEKKNKRILLSSVRKKKEVQLAALKEMQDASKELQSFLDNLKKTMGEGSVTSDASGFGSMRGHLPMPVEGKVLSQYGKMEHPKFRTITFNNGIEIAAQSGAEVKSIYKGRVIYTGWFRGYGKVVIIDHGSGFYTLFARLSKMVKDVNETVEQGEVVALVGDTGSLKGSHLYFEIRQKGVPLDPLNWLAYNR